MYTQDNKKMKMLIVDDDSLCRTILNEVCKEYGECFSAISGTEALEYITQMVIPFKVIFLDIMMPEMNGIETLIAIREKEKEHNLPQAKIIVCTALDDISHVIKAFQNGCDGYIQKPLDKREVLRFLPEV